MDKEKMSRIEEISKKIEKDFGKGTIIGGNEAPKSHAHISTGSLGLDKALGIGGLPKGKITEIYGWESSGKTTIALHVIAEAHKNPDSWCAFIDAEHAFNGPYAASLGVDLGRLKVVKPEFGEQALEAAERLTRTGDFDVVVIDSVAALVPKAETEREMGESSMGKQAMLISQACRKLTPVVAKSNTIFIFINQKREKIGVMFGSPDTTPGGNSLKFYTAVRLDVTRSTTNANSVIENDIKMGNLTKVKVIKNKVSPPFRECEFNILYGTGVDKLGELIAMAVETKVFEKAGTWYSYKDAKIGQGVIAVAKILADNEALFNEVKLKVEETFIPKEFILTEDDIKEINES